MRIYLKIEETLKKGVLSKCRKNEDFKKDEVSEFCNKFKKLYL
jgi:hypothetical protein